MVDENCNKSECKTHILKCWTMPFQAMRDGIKTFEFRKNDRDYHVGEILELHEWNPDTDYTGRVGFYKVTWCLYEGFGLPDGYCIMSVISMANDDRELKIRIDERNKVLDELTCLIKDAKESWSQRRVEMFHYTGLYCMIESLRKNVENDNIKNDNIESDDYDDQEGVNL